MTDDGNGKWVPIPVGMGGPLNPQDPGQNPNEGNTDPDGRGEGTPGEEEEESPFGPRKGEEVMVGPFHGVHSRSGKKSILIFNGRERYDEWHFTIELLMGQQQGGQMSPPQQMGQQQMAGGLPNYSIRWIGRPFPGFVQPQIPNNPGIGNPPGIDPGKLGPRRPPPQGGQRPENQ